MLPTGLLLILNSLLYLPLTYSLSPPTTQKNDAWHNDTPDQGLLSTKAIGKIKTRPTVVYKPNSLEAFHRKRRQAGKNTPFSYHDELEWRPVEVLGPDVEDRHTLAQLARMAGNAYALAGQKNWYEVDDAWRISFPFGWEEEDGFRGHVFLSADNSTVVLSIKGTTLQGPTSKLDKFNDNLLFSCCCARVDVSWVFRTVCDCYANRWRCDDRCLTEALVQDSLFYSIGTKLVDDLFRIYPVANLWLVGHSLGGALASLLGATYGLPAVAFESPGERLAAHRLYLPLPPAADSIPISPNGAISSSPEQKIANSNTSAEVFPSPRNPRPFPDPLASSITHVYHTADPIPFGTCSGAYSVCATGGYALETKCHLGKSIILDTVNKLHWLVDVRRHVIKEMVSLLDMGPEGRGVEWGNDIPEPEDPGPGEPDPDPWGKNIVISSVQEGLKILGWKDTWKNTRGKWRWGPGKGSNDKDREKEPRQLTNRVPKPILEEDCVECHKWEFGNFKKDWGGR
ncbi:alpha/beta-hydrolase [Coprinopsis marcescibilis]|uniref:triacylglycerol lipase n=1 Tax=Coprinopsis marcescibilis TaxID=230819 RepID=A0A5C3LBI7_COPMA|nr:alpha/beta-hydrolase [Coprinopsis marcescibilis]